MAQHIRLTASGKAVARAADGTGDFTGQGILRFLKTTIDPVGSQLITDEYTAYQAASPLYRRAIIKHKERYADGHTHTNTIEGFWPLIKRAWHGSHHHYSRNNLPIFIAESCWKYNNRKNENTFGPSCKGVFHECPALQATACHRAVGNESDDG